MNYFTPEGDPKLFACSCGKCDTKPTTRLLDTLQIIREDVGFPMKVTSGPRCPDYNSTILGSKYSEHIDGDGSDIECLHSRQRFILIDAAINSGINRIGIGKTFIHLGVSETNDQMVMWVY